MSGWEACAPEFGTGITVESGIIEPHAGMLELPSLVGSGSFFVFLSLKLVAGAILVRGLCRERRYVGEVYFSTKYRLECSE